MYVAEEICTFTYQWCYSHVRTSTWIQGCL